VERQTGGETDRWRDKVSSTDLGFIHRLRLTFTPPPQELLQGEKLESQFDHPPLTRDGYTGFSMATQLPCIHHCE